MTVAAAELERRAAAAQKMLQDSRTQWAALGKEFGELVKTLREMGPVLAEQEFDDAAFKQDAAEASLVRLVNQINEFIVQVNDGIKGRLGAPSVRSFLREVRNKLQSMMDNLPKEQAQPESVQRAMGRVQESVRKLEALAEGELDDTERHQLPDASFALVEAGGAPDDLGRTTPRSLRHFPYRDASGKVSEAMLRVALREVGSAPVSPAVQAKARATLCQAAAAQGLDVPELQESRAPSTLPKVDLAYTVSLAEATYDAKKGEVVAVLIEAGTNEAKGRHYPVNTIKEAAPQFAGLKMYINHPTAQEQQQRPERDLRDWASTITESWFDDGKALGRISVHQGWLRDLLGDGVARQHVGLSINTRGITHQAKIDGKDRQVVEKILVERGEQGRMSSVDWVTEPGARGRVVEVFESRRTDMDNLQLIQLSDLKTARPDLVEAIRTDALAEGRAAATKELEGQMDTKLTETVTKMDDRLTKVEARALRAENEAAIRKTLGGSKLPQAFQEEVVEALAGQTFETSEKLTEAVQAKVQGQIAKLKSAGFKVADDGGSTKPSGSLMETVQARLEQRAGIKSDVKKEE